MDYSAFKGIQFFLFFGAALGFGLWQVISVKRSLHKDHNDRNAQNDRNASGGDRADDDSSSN